MNHTKYERPVPALALSFLGYPHEGQYRWSPQQDRLGHIRQAQAVCTRSARNKLGSAGAHPSTLAQRTGRACLQPKSWRRSDPPYSTVSSSLSNRHTDLRLSRKPNRSTSGRASPSPLQQQNGLRNGTETGRDVHCFEVGNGTRSVIKCRV
jgi:hypothetical protein